MDVTRSVPPEILSMVFFLLRDSARRATSTEWFIVTAVCRRWREIALATPFLWSRICIHYRRPWPPDMLSAFFDRSGSVDLHIELDIDKLMHATIAPILLLHAGRVQSLRLVLVYWHEDCMDVQTVVAGMGPKLVSLSLGGSELFTVGPSVASLRSLSMMSSKFTLLARLDNLTYLELDDIGCYNNHEELYDHLSQLFQYCPNIETLAILDMAWIHAFDVEEGAIVLPYQLPFPRLRTLRLRDKYEYLPAMVGALLVPPHVSVDIEARTCHWREWTDNRRPRPFKNILLGGMDQTSSVSVLPFDRVVLTAGAEDHLALFAAFTASSDERPRRLVKILGHRGLAAGIPGDFSELPKVLLEDFVALSMVLRPSVLEVHLADHLGSPPLLSLLSAWYPDVQKLAVGGTHGTNHFIQNLFKPDALRLREALLCTADASQLDVETLVARINHRAQRPADLCLKRLVICLRPDDTGLSLDAFASLSSQVRVEITRGCPVCHRVAGPEEVKLFQPSGEAATSDEGSDDDSDKVYQADGFF
ncbi:hypothetical protein K466DRAFT_659802 [Polyporus arcularius HHB13444]|uniref:F-box domain-containing protein n=1 Tax=Polyporus arcularius HHB13444 TaxID=1314778 RepID=A0A5C3PV85_9APHY|nr:hypothetical protein K466DRAFT_659802 [Polyporus arcularius HHB13444]